MSKKWYNLFVSIDQPAVGSAEEGNSVTLGEGAGGRSPAQTVAQIAAGVPAESKFTTPVGNVASFDEIYSAAEIRPPAHGYTIFKVAEMLQNEHIRNLPSDVKRSSVLVALDAAGVKLQEIIEDAVRRDRALDTFERVQLKALEELEARKSQENRKIQDEIDRFVAQQRARIEANSDEVAKEKERFYGWRLKKQQEEQKIADTVSHFVTENPITTGTATAAPSGNPTAQKS